VEFLAPSTALSAVSGGGTPASVLTETPTPVHTVIPSTVERWFPLYR